MKKILVTGASGFIGRHCLPLLAEKGYQIFALSSKRKKEKNLCEWITTDLLQPGKINNIIKQIKPTYLLHLAWYTEHGKYWNDDINLEWVKSSLDLLKSFASNGGKRVVMAGSCAEYDWKDSLCKETCVFQNPQTFYGTCKLSLFHIASRFAQSHNLSFAWGRIFFLFGPHEQKKRLIPSAISSFLRKEKFICSGSNLIRDFLYVKDVADAFVSLLDSSLNGPVNIASGVGTQIKTFIEQIAEILLVKNLLQCHEKNEVPSLIAETKKLHNELKWRPKYDFNTALTQTIEWWKQQISSEFSDH